VSKRDTSVAVERHDEGGGPAGPARTARLRLVGGRARGGVEPAVVPAVVASFATRDGRYARAVRLHDQLRPAATPAPAPSPDRSLRPVGWAAAPATPLAPAGGAGSPVAPVPTAARGSLADRGSLTARGPLSARGSLAAVRSGAGPEALPVGALAESVAGPGQLRRCVHRAATRWTVLTQRLPGRTRARWGRRSPIVGAAAVVLLVAVGVLVAATIVAMLAVEVVVGVARGVGTAIRLTVTGASGGAADRAAPVVDLRAAVAAAGPGPGDAAVPLLDAGWPPGVRSPSR
jgi:hypothetical protein